MAASFSTEDYLNLSRLLQQNPELRADLRRLVLTDDLLDLPTTVRDLGAAQQRTETRLEELAAAQQRTEARLDELSRAVSDLTAAQLRTEARLEELLLAVRQLTATAEAHEARLLSLENSTGTMRGMMLEAQYRDKAASFFGPLLHRLRPVDLSRFDRASLSVLSDAELRSMYNLDLVLSGTPRRYEGAPEVMLALEVSWVVDSHDVSGAVERARLLHRVTARPVLPLVAGDSLTQGAVYEASRQAVVVLRDGRDENWEAALRQWAGIGETEE